MCSSQEASHMSEPSNPQSSYKKFPGGATRTNVTNSGETDAVKLSTELAPNREIDSNVNSGSPKVKRLSKSDITLLPPGVFFEILMV